MRKQGWVDRYRFLITPKPYSDELLSSWLTRTAFSHGYSLTPFVSRFLKYDGSSLTRTDIDFQDTHELFEKLAHKSRLTYAQIFQMSLQSEDGYLFESEHGLYPPKQIRKLIDKRTHYGLMFCPKCLAEDLIPYWRKHWRYYFYNACPKHKVFLADRCGVCSARIRFSKMTLSDAIVYCGKCGRDLRKTITQKVPKLYEDGLSAITYFEQGLKNGSFLVNNIPAHSLSVFHVHTILSYLLYRQKNLFLEGFSMLDPYRNLCQNEQNYHSKKATPIYKSFYLNAMVFYLMEDFSSRLKGFAEENHLTHRDFLHGFKKAPFWYKKAIDTYVPFQDTVGRQISESEVSGAINYLKSTGQTINQKNVSNIVGCHTTVHKEFVSIYKKLTFKVRPFT